MNFKKRRNDTGATQVQVVAKVRALGFPKFQQSHLSQIESGMVPNYDLGKAIDEVLTQLEVQCEKTTQGAA